MGRCPHNKAGGQKKKYSHKSARRTKFEKKGDDIVYTELRAPEKVRQIDALDAEDLPGMGQFYCLQCDRHFVSATVKADHWKTKMHRKRVKLMEGAPPHSQLDADMAGGMGRPDNGPRLRAVEVPTEMVL